MRITADALTFQGLPVRTKRRSTSQNSWVAVDSGAWPHPLKG
jgi:hypothetical protein